MQTSFAFLCHMFPVTSGLLGPSLVHFMPCYSQSFCSVLRNGGKSKGVLTSFTSFSVGADILPNMAQQWVHFLQ